ncbi:beta-ketoacyl-[acyl-carrier-protein] synthase family protein [Flexivirga sp. ID2601S]|uniref:Beta-ketoacyl-[acyl-carrier-protein] synthase family protein n=1 Tax=Flexivirga aerilata TaxID=1656889 RepID=A0A849ACM4_9MICO|nr:beta-ketoacyl-[acyl-carrier-protein] synthase family protein [Flexivirga aerilata]NNG38275.1 beta-ketoacyl-[acyl-carrier-protein] synthase family protein [Flexivirga aerilata]
MPRRAVITGLGAVAPGGVGIKQFWELLSDGRSATRTITSFDASGFRSQVAAEVDFVPHEVGLTPRQADRLDRATQFAVVAAGEAINDSGLGAPADRSGAELDGTRVAVAFGSAVGCTTSMEREYTVLSEAGSRWLVDPDRAVCELYEHFVPSSIVAELARTIGARGPVALISDGCTSGLDAVGHAVDLIREGSADVVLTGGTDAPISPITLACFDAIKATTPRNDDPEHASRPFDATRNGLVLGEGAAALVVEDLDHALRRGAPIYAEVSGFASRCNAFHMTGLREDGIEMAEAIGVALRQAGVAPSTVDYVNAHGSSTKQNDRHETAAFKRSLGRHAHQVPVSSIKSMIGHSLGAIGALELVASTLALHHDLVPPTANLTQPDPALDLDYVPLHARRQRVDTVLSVGSGFGGFQSAAVLSSPLAAAL